MNNYADKRYQVSFMTGHNADLAQQHVLLCSVLWDEPYHSKYTYFHGIRLHEPHTNSFPQFRVFDDPCIAMQCYLNAKWKGFYPTMEISAGFTNLLIWKAEKPVVKPDPSLPF